MCLICDQRTMYINRDLPSECLVNTVVLRRRGKILITSYNMRNPHKMVINYVCKIVCRISIRFDQDQILHLFIVDCDITVNNIVEGCSSLCRHIETDNMRFSRIQTTLNLFFGKVETSLIIDGDLLACNCTFHTLQFFLAAEAVVCISLLNKLFCIFQVHACCLTLTLYIRTESAVFIRSLIMDKSGFLKGTVNNIYGSLHITFLVCIFNTKDKISAFMFCDQISIKSCS